MANKLPPTPVGVPPGHSFWNDWYEKLRQLVNNAVSWATINFTGSNLTDIVTRNHNDLQSIQGGAATQYYHMTSAQNTLVVNWGALGNGITVKTGASTVNNRAIVAGSANLTVTNGNGVAGNPTIDLSATPAIGAATGTSLALTGQVTSGAAASFQSTSVALTNYAGAAAGTLANAPAAGNPTKWIAINDNGTIRKIPTWL